MFQTESEYTIGAIKPTFYVLGGEEPVLSEIRRFGIEILEQRTLTLSSETALLIYPDSNGVQEELIKHSTSGPWRFFLGVGSDARRRLRTIIGTTKLDDRPGRGIRGFYGEDRIKNAIHSVSSPEEFLLHKQLFFPEVALPLTKETKKVIEGENGWTRFGYHGLIRMEKQHGTVIKSMKYEGGKFPDSLFREYLVLNLISDLGLSPKPICYSTGNPGVDEIKMEFINGRHWADLTTTEKGRLLPGIALALRTLHRETEINDFFDSLGVRKYGNVVDCFVDNIYILREAATRCGFVEAVDFLDKHEDNLLLLILGEAKPSTSFSLIHFDISPGNLMITSDGKVKLIDWGSSHFNDPALDIARTIAKITSGSWAEIFHLLNCYQADTHLIKRTLAYLPLAYLASAVGKVENKNKETPQRAAFRNLTNIDLLRMAEAQVNRIIAK